jgi:hypothetical protein
MVKYGPVKSPRGLFLGSSFSDAFFAFSTSSQFTTCFAETSHYTFNRITIVYLLIIIAILKEGGKSMTAKPCVQSDNGPIGKNRSSMSHSQAMANCLR